MKKERFFTRLEAAKNYLNSSRPTAVNLSWATNRMEKFAIRFFEQNFETDNLTTILKTVDAMKGEALTVWQEDIWHAINILEVRGAPAIGVTAALSMYLAAKNCYGQIRYCHKRDVSGAREGL